MVLGDRIVVVVQKQRSFGPESGPGGSVSTSAANKVRRGDIRHAIIVRTAKEYQRVDGSVIKFGDNACVLINKAGDMVGTRLSGEYDVTFSTTQVFDFREGRKEGGVRVGVAKGAYLADILIFAVLLLKGIVGAELRDKQWSKILSLAPMHV